MVSRERTQTEFRIVRNFEISRKFLLLVCGPPQKCVQRICVLALSTHSRHTVELMRPEELTSRGLLAPLVVAGSVLVVVAAAVNLLPALRNSASWEGSVALSAELPAGDVDVAAEAAYQYMPLTGLIDPHNGDNGTDPAQTTTGACN